MEVRVQLFSMLKDCLPETKGMGTVSLPDGASLSDLMTKLGVDKRLGQDPGEIVENAAWLVMVNGHGEKDVGRKLEDGDLVQVFPWVAGG